VETEQTAQPSGMTALTISGSFSYQMTKLIGGKRWARSKRGAILTGFNPAQLVKTFVVTLKSIQAMHVHNHTTRASIAGVEIPTRFVTVNRLSAGATSVSHHGAQKSS
jgi:hypothetical protein